MTRKKLLQKGSQEEYKIEGKKKRVLVKYDRKELKQFKDRSGKITICKERRLFAFHKNVIGEPEVGIIVSLPELKALIKSAEKRLKNFKHKNWYNKKNKRNGFLLGHLNEEVTFLIFEREVK